MAPELSQEWEGYSFLYQKERYENQPLDHYRFVVAATNDKKLNETIAERCKDADILCNTASHPQKGDVIFPVLCGREALLRHCPVKAEPLSLQKS